MYIQNVALQKTKKTVHDPYPYVRCEGRGEKEERRRSVTFRAALAVISGMLSPKGRCFYNVKVKRGHKSAKGRPFFHRQPCLLLYYTAAEQAAY